MKWINSIDTNRILYAYIRLCLSSDTYFKANNEFYGTNLNINTSVESMLYYF